MQIQDNPRERSMKTIRKTWPEEGSVRGGLPGSSTKGIRATEGKVDATVREQANKSAVRAHV